MQIVYAGPFDAVVIAATGQTATRGEPLEVDADLGARLCEQAVWTEVAVLPDERPAKRAKSDAAVTAEEA